MRLKTALAVAAMCAISAVAHALPIYTFSFSGVKLADGDTVTGTFTTDSTFKNFSAINVVVSGTKNTVTYQLSAPVSVTSSDSRYFQFDMNSRSDELRIYMSSPYLTASGASIILGGSSYEYDPYRGSSAITAGSITAYVAPPATPEPSSIALLGTGLVGLAGVLRRRVRV